MPKRESWVDILHVALRRAILEQALEPGAKLPEDAIGQQFGVSRTIVRRALERLAADELIQIQPNRGASVIRPTLAQARELFEVRIDFEDVVVRRLCGQLTPQQVERLNEAVAAEDAAHHAKSMDYIRLSANFHVLLAEMTGSPLLIRYLRQLIWQSAVALRLYGRPDWDDRLHEHHDLINLIATGQSEAACKAMRHHLRMVLTRGLQGPKLPLDPGLKDILRHYAETAKKSEAAPSRRKGIIKAS